MTDPEEEGDNATRSAADLVAIRATIPVRGSPGSPPTAESATKYQPPGPRSPRAEVRRETRHASDVMCAVAIVLFPFESATAPLYADFAARVAVLVPTMCHTYGAFAPTSAGVAVTGACGRGRRILYSRSGDMAMDSVLLRPQVCCCLRKYSRVNNKITRENMGLVERIL